MKWRNRRSGMRSNRAPGAKQYSVWRFDRGGARKGRGGDPEREGIFPTRPLRPDVVAEGGSIGRGGLRAPRRFDRDCRPSWFWLERRVREAEGAGCRLTLLLTLDGLDDLLGSLAAEARHCEQKGARAVGSSI